MTHIPWQVLPLLGFASFLGLILCWQDRRLRLAVLSLLMMTLGAARFLLAEPRIDERCAAAYNGVGWVTLEAVVVGQPAERDTFTNLRVRAERLTLPDDTVREVKGFVLVRAHRYPRRVHGDRLRVSGLLKAPPVFEAFSYREYLARQGIHSLMERVEIELLAEGRVTTPRGCLYGLKRRAQSMTATMLPEPQAALLTGILLGVEAGIPEDLMDDFEATGTSHIIVISGFNITIVAGVFAGLAGRLLHRRRALLMAMAAVAVYTMLVGASAAVVRAALMGALYLFARYVGRQSYAPVSLSAAALLMTAWNPNALWDRGLLLSFAATAGLLVYAEPLEELLEHGLAAVTSADRAQQIVGLVSESLPVTVAAQLTTLPILMESFGWLSPITLISNLLVLPAQPSVMLFGGLATVLGLLLEPLGRMIGWVAWLFLTYTIEVVRLTARLPWASVPVQVENWMVWGYYVVLGCATWWLRTTPLGRRALVADARDWLSSRLESKLLVGATGVVLALAFCAWRGLPDGRLHVHVLDVGQGDAILIQTRSGRQLLVDGGPCPSLLPTRVGRRMPFWDRSLDAILLTHPDADHITGLVEILERYTVDTVVYREMGCTESICERWRELLDEREAAVYCGEAGLSMAFDQGVRMEVLHPGPKLLAGNGFNDNSLVLRLSYGEVSVLLTGDIGAAAERQLLTDGVVLESTVLKVAHHGGCSSSTPDFLEAVDPAVAVVSVGEDNDFGHLCEAVLQRLEWRLRAGGEEGRIYRTDTHGTVEIVSDGARVLVETAQGR